MYISYLRNNKLIMSIAEMFTVVWQTSKQKIVRQEENRKARREYSCKITRATFTFTVIMCFFCKKKITKTPESLFKRKCLG